MLNRINNDFLYNLPTSENGNIKHITYNNITRGLIFLLNLDESLSKNSKFQQFVKERNVSTKEQLNILLNEFKGDSLKILANKLNLSVNTVEDQLLKLFDFVSKHDQGIKNWKEGNDKNKESLYTQKDKFESDLSQLLNAMKKSKDLESFYFTNISKEQIQTDFNNLFTTKYAESYVLSKYYESGNFYIIDDYMDFNITKFDTISGTVTTTTTETKTDWNKAIIEWYKKNYPNINIENEAELQKYKEEIYNNPGNANRSQLLNLAQYLMESNPDIVDFIKQNKDVIFKYFVYEDPYFGGQDPIDLGMQVARFTQEIQNILNDENNNC